jgi:hypothetical protein
VSRGGVALLLLLVIPTPTFAYRPFVSTDAAVADQKEVEVELGYFNLARTGRENTFTIPSLVLNYGVAENWEIVGEFGLEGSPTFEVTDPGLFLKGVLKEGILQEKSGLSVAIEAGPLLPSTLPHERGVGLEAIGIVSGRISPFTVHVNGGGGVDRDDARPFGLWGVIGELAVAPKFRFVGEVNGESTRGELPNNSALLGFIWQPASAVFLDAGVRHGISRAAPDWQFTLGLTFSFSLPSPPGH